jgi:hypothetical protein
MTPAVRYSIKPITCHNSAPANLLMSSSHEGLPYSVSSGSAFNTFDKLQGPENYARWKNNMRTVLMSLRQWDVVAGSVHAPIPVDMDSPTLAEAKATEAWNVRAISAFMEISFRVADSAKYVLGDTFNPKVAWDVLAKHFGAKQEALQWALISKLQLAAWDGTGTIHIHRDYMVDLRLQLVDAGMSLTDQAFLFYFVESLPPYLDLLVALCDDTNNIDFLCDKIAKYEMRLKLRAAKSGKVEAESGSVVMFGQQTPDKKIKGKGKRVMSKVTCYGCNKKGHVISRCPDKKEKKDETSAIVCK